MRTGLNNKERKLVMNRDWDKYFDLGIQKTKDNTSNDCTLKSRSKQIAYRKRYNGKSKE